MASLLLKGSNPERTDDVLLPYTLAHSPESLPPSIRQSMEMSIFPPEPVPPTLTGREHEGLIGLLSALPIVHSRRLRPPSFLTGAHNGGVPSPSVSSVRFIHPRERFKCAVRSVILMQTATKPTPPPREVGAVLPAERRQCTASDVSKGGKLAMDPVLATLVPKPTTLQVTQNIPAHSTLVKYLQFSPSGKFLTTTSWDRTTAIYRVGDPCTIHRILAHVRGFVGQVAWSPTEKHLLTKLTRGIKIWTNDGVCIKTIDRPRIVQSVAWLPTGDAFMSVEGSEVVQLDVKTGRVLGIHEFKKVTIHDVAVSSDSKRLLVVGPTTTFPDDLKLSKYRVEKQLLVYNIQRKQIENRTPMLNYVRDIIISRNGQVALISYENKAPSQLWELEHVKAPADGSTISVQLTLRHTYMPKASVDLAGPSYFGGKDDQLVLCAGKFGDIHIWDRQSAVLLHHFRAQVLGGDLTRWTSIAWNSASEKPFMFATGSHDGKVQIWTQPPDSPSRTETDAGGDSHRNRQRAESIDTIMNMPAIPRSRTWAAYARGEDGAQDARRKGHPRSSKSGRRARKPNNSTKSSEAHQQGRSSSRSHSWFTMPVLVSPAKMKVRNIAAPDLQATRSQRQSRRQSTSVSSSDSSSSDGSDRQEPQTEEEEAKVGCVASILCCLRSRRLRRHNDQTEENIEATPQNAGRD